MKSIAKLRGWIGESVSRRLAIPGLVLILLLLVQAALSSGSAWLLVGRLEDSSNNSNASMKLTERLLGAAQELSDHARETVAATDDDQRTKSIAAFNETKARLGEVVDEISTKLSSDPSLQQAVSEGLSTFVVSGVKATRLAQKGRIEDAQRELQVTFDPNLLAYVISTVTALNQTSAESLSGVLEAGQLGFLDRAGDRSGGGCDRRVRRIPGVPRDSQFRDRAGAIRRTHRPPPRDGRLRRSAPLE